MRGLLLTDIDGTIADARGLLWEESIVLSRAAEDLGYRIALCSGRPIWSVVRVAEYLGPVVEYLVSFQGALISHREPNNPSRWTNVHSHCLSPKIIKTIRPLIDPSASFWMYTENHWYIDSIDAAAHEELAILGTAWTNVGFPCSTPALKLLIVGDKPHHLLFERVDVLDLPVLFLPSRKGYIEVVSDTAGNAKGATEIIELARLSGLISHTISVGDGINDIGMLSAADIAVTFEDAPHQLCKLADVILPKDRPAALRRLATLLKEVSEKGHCV